ncbi:hypothetical protein EI982_04585 [Haloplanus rallus]|uniref:Glycerophosphoryl diester phosphodiesterase membrane domain-containing protein n=1 Tax=Haloplanus rallus TaxID=1816183 RepID=A0A6B9F1R1_9EURY|nr:hypothetical protein [Haloplanus rallus]QGX94108.1 hypothetical protein EI982_04585 [Haloplanus rallus]
MPSWYAFAALSAAREATEDLLRPLDRGVWLRLAVITLFVGVGGGVPTGGNANTNLSSGGGMSEMPSPSLPDLGSTAVLIAGIVALVLALVLLWNLVGAVMEFVLVRALRDRSVSIRDPFAEEFRPGLRLFGFRIAVGLGTLLLIAVPILAVFVGGIGLSAALFVLVVPLLLVLLVVGLVTSVILGLTTDFVVPTMLTEDRGVLDGWRRLWPTLRAEWKQVGLYLVAKFVLGIAVGLVVSIATLLVAIALAIPFVVVGGALYLAIAAAGAAHVGAVVVVPLVLLFVLSLIVVSLLLQVPALVFVRYYSLSVLGMLVPELDLVGVDRPDGDDDGQEVGGDGDDDDGQEVGGDGDDDDDSQEVGGDGDDDDPDPPGRPAGADGREAASRHGVTSVA